MAKILLTTFGSYGDLHPYVAMGQVLTRAGHEVVLATHARYGEKVARHGLAFRPILPALGDMTPGAKWLEKVNHPRNGSLYILKELVLPHLASNYRALVDAATGADLVISHLLVLPAALAAEKHGIPWLQCALAPSALVSATDPPIMGEVPHSPLLRRLGPRAARATFWLLRQPAKVVLKPVADLRRREGLPPAPSSRLFPGAYSGHGTLALFDAVLGPRQADWPERTDLLGFPFFDEDKAPGLTPGTEAFLRAGEPPVVFTLGSAVVRMATPFYRRAYEAVKATGHRAILLIGDNDAAVTAEARRDPQVHVANYEPFSLLFPRAAAVAHQCGIGTTSQALRAGIPQLLCPFAHDQPDNASRVVRLGCGVALPGRKATAAKMARALTTLLSAPTHRTRATEVARLLTSDFDRRLLAAVAASSVRSG